MTTNGRKAEDFSTKLIDEITDIKAGQGLMVLFPPGSGKTRILVLGISHFLRNNPGSSILFVTDTLVVTQQAEALREAEVSVTALRDQNEARDWAYHSPQEERPVLVAADNLFSRYLPGLLQGREFDLLLFNSSRSLRSDHLSFLLTRAPRFVWVDPSPVIVDALTSTAGPNIHRLVAPETMREQVSSMAPNLERRVVEYAISDAERKLVSEGLQFFSHMKGEPDPRARQAAVSSRAAFSNALLATQYRRVAPGAHRFLQRQGRSTSPDPLEKATEEGVDKNSTSDETLFPVWGMSPPDSGDQIDALLDKLDDLEGDNKLEVMLELVQSQVRDGRGVVVLSQSSATSDYVLQFLATRMRGTLVDVLGRHSPPQEDLFYASGIPRVLIVVDKELSYLTEAPVGYVHMWFDPPLTRAHGYRRLEFIGSAGGVVYALIARPPDHYEQRYLRPLGFDVSVRDNDL